VHRGYHEVFEVPLEVMLASSPGTKQN